MLDLSPSPGAPADFPFLEKTVRQKIGLPKDDMRALRKQYLTDADFTIYKKALYLSKGAVEKLYSAAARLATTSRCAQSSSDGAHEKNEPPSAALQRVTAEPASVETLRVVRVNLANKRLMLACADKDDPDQPKKTLRIRVRTTEGFRPRMEIQARLVPGYADLYDLVSRYPKRPTTTI